MGGRNGVWPIVGVDMELDRVAHVVELHNKGGVVSDYRPKLFKPFDAQNGVSPTDRKYVERNAELVALE